MVLVVHKYRIQSILIFIIISYVAIQSLLYDSGDFFSEIRKENIS